MIRRFLSEHPRLARVVLFLGIATIALCALRFAPKPPLAAGFASSTAVYDAHGNLLRLTLSADDKYRLWTPLADISPQLVDAVLLHEDQYFRFHFGVNPSALLRGAWRTFFTDERRQGGSTITMQVARMKYRLNSRTIPGKIGQIARAIELEALYGKDEILEAYLNLVPAGGNIEGVGAASLVFFGKRAEKLSLPEALALAVIPQSPARRGAGRATNGNERDTLLQARAALFAQWSERHPADAASGAMRTPLMLRSPDMLPFAAPHAVDALLAARERGTARSAEIVATLDLSLQRLLERRIRDYVATNGRLGIRNASAMLVDYRTMEVKAQVGSADFFNADIDGQVNGTLAKRSPGSTLKPFVYALGVDQGILHPQTVLKDAPTSFGPFSPENFDGHFAGPITAQDALVKSRNIPAVYVASRLAKPSLYDFMREAGVARMKNESHYGLALVLGGGEVTMEELVTLYAMLGNRGELKPLRYRAAAKPAKPAAATRLLSEEASFVTLEMLKENPRPGDTPLASQRLPVAWKTGTSYGFHDAWSVGVFGPYVLAVWVGNFNGEANPAFVGVQTAAPLFFNIVDAIAAGRHGLAEPPRPVPQRLTRVSVCAASGDLPNTDCPRTAQTWFIPGVSPIRVSTVHRAVPIDTRSGLRACAATPTAQVRYETYEFWPSDMMKIFREAGMPRRTPPPPAPGCADDGAADAGGAPSITSPLRGVTYTLRQARLGEESVTLSATLDGGARQVYWFANDRYLGGSPGSGALAWKPDTPGRFVLRAVDDRGRSDVRDVNVAVVQ